MAKIDFETRDIFGENNGKGSQDVNRALASANVAAEKKRNFASEQTDKNLAFLTPERDAAVAYKTEETRGKNLNNNLTQEFGQRKEEALTSDMENTSSLNQEYGGDLKKLALDTGNAYNKHLAITTENEATANKLAKLNLNSAAFLQNEQARKNTDGTQKIALDTYKKAANYEPLGVFSGSGTSRDYIDQSKMLLGETPDTSLQKIARLVPGVPQTRALNQRSKVRAKYDELATPTK